jgi:hypothetical protein
MEWLVQLRCAMTLIVKGVRDAAAVAIVVIVLVVLAAPVQM